MSLSGMHSAHVSMSSDFSSSLGLAQMLGEYEAQERAALQRSPRIDENTPLTNGKGRQDPLKLNATLLLTIIVVTIGSSLQFGYAVSRNMSSHQSISIMAV
jgi:hypothetical protein